MRADIKGIIRSAVENAAADGLLSAGARDFQDIIVEKPRKEEFGDFSTNIAMLLAPLEKKKPREIASEVSKRIALSPRVSRCEVAGPGFINIFLSREYWQGILEDVLEKGDKYGRSAVGKGERVQVEFVSANPTGPLHIGHGRGAAVGDALSNVLEAVGFDVTREFYINDVGRQIDTLGNSVRLRYLEILGEKVAFPEDHYKGDYIRELAKEFLNIHANNYKNIHESEALPVFKEFASNKLLERIKKDLEDFGVSFDVWKSEKTLHEGGLVKDTIEKLRSMGFIYEDDGALWFRTTDFGDDKDRVLIKADGSYTYFSSDIAYHREKIGRGFTAVVDLWGADHHGYEARVRALFKALGKEDSALKVIFIQLVALLRSGVPVPMGKREGEFVTLRQVMDEVGVDACRFFFLMRKSDAHLDFDLELAKKEAPENPVYYVQYCHARIESIIGFAREKGFEVPGSLTPGLFEKLTEKDEIDLIKHLASFPEVIEKSAAGMEPHRVTFYLMEAAGLFHPYYNRNRVVTEDRDLTMARLVLCRAVQTVVKAGLKVLGVRAPLKM